MSGEATTYIIEVYVSRHINPYDFIVPEGQLDFVERHNKEFNILTFEFADLSSAENAARTLGEQSIYVEGPAPYE